MWSSSSPDFGVQGVLDRFTQIAPKILFAVNGYFYNGKVVDVRAKVLDIVANLPSVERVVWVEYVADLPVLPANASAAVGTDSVSYTHLDVYKRQHMNAAVH